MKPKIAGLLLFILSPLWLNTLEICFDFGWRFLPVLIVFFIFTAGWGSVLVLGILKTRRARDLWIFAAPAVAVLCLFLDIFNYAIIRSNQKYQPWEYEELTGLLKEGKPLPEPFTVLLEKDDIYVVGQPRSGWNLRYVGIDAGYDVHYSVMTGEINHFLGEEFLAYADLVDKRKYLYDFSNEEPDIQASRLAASRLEDFLAWQYPDCIFMFVSLRNPEEPVVNLMYTDNRSGKDGIYPVEPILKDMRNLLRYGPESFDHFEIYGKMIAYTFRSPHYRTDLVNDPFFYYWKGDRKEAERRMDSLPEKRRVFLRNLLNR